MKLVSAIMPTRGRVEFAKRAVESFLSQTYSNKELIVLDDLDEPSFPDGCFETGVLRLASSGRLNIPQKRNECCRLANGDYIMHWDSDDWSVPERMADQVRRLEESCISVTGYHAMLFHEFESGQWGRYVGYPMEPLGTSLCYRKDWWALNPFIETLNIGEDGAFAKQARDAREILTAEGLGMMVAGHHAGNTSPKDMGNCRPIDMATIPAGFLR